MTRTATPHPSKNEPKTHRKATPNVTQIPDSGMEHQETNWHTAANESHPPTSLTLANLSPLHPSTGASVSKTKTFDVFTCIFLLEYPSLTLISLSSLPPPLTKRWIINVHSTLKLSTKQIPHLKMLMKFFIFLNYFLFSFHYAFDIHYKSFKPNRLVRKPVDINKSSRQQQQKNG